jgi:hypothetical protein
LFSYDYVHNKSGRPWPERLDFSGALIGILRGVRAGDRRRWPRRASAAGRRSACRARDRVHVLSAGRVHARRGAVVVAEGPDRAYYENRRSPEERLIAYQLYWRGETFYTSNEIYEGPTEDRTVFDQDGADEKLKAWMSRHRGRRTFFLYERYQQARLQGMLPPESRASFRVVDEQNNKFSWPS